MRGGDSGGWILLASAAVLASACGHRHRYEMDRPPPRPAAPLSDPRRLCVTDAPRRPCLKAEEVEAWLSRPDLEILGSARPPAGIQGAQVLTLRVPGSPPVVFRAKWRAWSTTDAKNSPRRELAAHAVQKLFLDPQEWVVPPSAPHCFPVARYRALVDALGETLRGATCVHGALSYWLENVQTLPDAERERWFDFSGGGPLDRGLFEKSAIYRDSVADLNLVTYLIGHADSHWKQFLIAMDQQYPVVYSVDNSMSFGAKKNRRVSEDWSQLLVPALPRRAIERLRAASVHVDDLAAFALLDLGNGQKLPIGLDAHELDGLRRRLADLLARADRGDVKVY